MALPTSAARLRMDRPVKPGDDNKGRKTGGAGDDGEGSVMAERGRAMTSKSHRVMARLDRAIYFIG
jgi:hypothetical protein